MSTAMTAPQVEQYYQDVRAALADLAPEQREDLLEDLAEHLAEVAAEDDSRWGLTQRRRTAPSWADHA